MRYLSLIVAIVLFSLPVTAADKTRSKKSKKDKTYSLSDKKLKDALDKKIPAVFHNVPLSEICKMIQTTSKLKKVSMGEGVDDDRLGWLVSNDGVRTPIHIKFDKLQITTRELLGWVAAVQDLRAVIVGDLEIEFQIVDDPEDKKWEGKLIPVPKCNDEDSEGEKPAQEPVKKGSGKKSSKK